MGRAAETALVALTFLLAAMPAAAAPPQGAAASEWAKGNRVLLGVTQEQRGFSAQWRFQRSADEDILIELEETRAGAMRAGAMLLVGKNALLARDVPLERGHELDAFNGPLLMLQLALRLLERAQPEGPAAVARDTPVDMQEPARTIQVTGVGADGEFYAPWRVAGSIGPAPNGQIRFELEFVSANDKHETAAYRTRIVGLWQKASPPLQLPDSMGLHGWRVFQLKPVVRAHGASNSVGLGTSVPMAFRNLGELRRRALEWADEGARRARWQCS